LVQTLRTVEHGCDDYLSNPIGRLRMLLKIEHYLRQPMLRA
jgi:hypothetical protein